MQGDAGPAPVFPPAPGNPQPPDAPGGDGGQPGGGNDDGGNDDGGNDDGGQPGGGNQQFNTWTNFQYSPLLVQGDCQLGAQVGPSACSLTCTNAGAGGAAQGVSVTYQPWIGGNISLCDPIEQRAQVTPCTPTAACTQCQDLVRNGAETDIDCGGGAVPLPAGIRTPRTIEELMQLVVGNVTANPPAGDGGGNQNEAQNNNNDDNQNGNQNGNNNQQQQQGVIPFPFQAVLGQLQNTINLLLPTGACPRCDYGRQCGNHTDCNLGAGLICMTSVCSPFWMINSTWAVDFNVTMQGVDPHEFAGTAVSAFRNLVAGTASGNGAAAGPLNVTVARITFAPGAGVAPPAVAPGEGDAGGDAPEGQDPGASDPGASDPGASDPGASDPGASDPGASDPGASDPGASDPGAQDPDAPVEAPPQRRRRLSSAKRAMAVNVDGRTASPAHRAAAREGRKLATVTDVFIAKGRIIAPSQAAAQQIAANIE
jgi:hypothetical protein